MDSAKKFKAAINRSFNEHGGIFWQGVNDEQLSSYVMSVVREFATNNPRELTGSFTLGRQRNLKKVDQFGEYLEEIPGWYDEEDTDVKTKDDFDSAIYILNENIQVSI
jgi:hypothetical protein